MTYSHIRQLANRRQLVLGSGSPRRVALLKEVGPMKLLMLSLSALLNTRLSGCQVKLMPIIW
jgi:hypothetical protein